ncbi:hypothetical protein MM326_13630 [Alkalihalobacillus sp. LMS6]|uniref:hypothetical protein n=1 Tax=Alkalihalobacillus sp. LMS6 TaxID=2924034 RepID=UPI0020D06203|nr:hypothetical protein [Alkalihalobacillus sp. LMS6]UTR05148.1 hypothetical protein MM326_13630 [Alkalihalobacillus sp. LMS6]
MAKYKANPFYSVKIDKKQVEFNFFGEYETKDSEEIAKLDALTPSYLQRLEETKPAEEPPKPAPKKAPAKRKTSAK